MRSTSREGVTTSEDAGGIGGFPPDTVITDAEDKYEFRSLAVADYTGKVSSERYKDTEFTVSIQTGVKSGRSFLMKALE